MPAKKPRLKKPSQEVRDAQWRLDSAVVRGEPQPTLDKLRRQLDRLKSAGVNHGKQAH